MVHALLGVLQSPYLRFELPQQKANPILPKSCNRLLSLKVPSAGQFKTVPQAYARQASKSSTVTRRGSHIVQASSNEAHRHAVLHDFCMIIPYGMIITVAGIVSLFFGSSWRGVALAASGMSELWLTRCSLKSWRAGTSSKPYTAASAVGAGGLAFHFRKNMLRGVARTPNAILMVISLAAFVFLLYNLLAGGNPPKEDPAVTAQDAATIKGKF